MKVKEIIEILGVEPEKLINQLDNVGIEADLDTEIPQDVIKKLSKLYKKEIKPIKAKKSVETPVVVTETTKEENQVVDNEVVSDVTEETDNESTEEVAEETAEFSGVNDNNMTDKLIKGFLEELLALEKEGKLSGKFAGILHITNDSIADVVKSDKTDI